MHIHEYKHTYMNFYLYKLTYHILKYKDTYIRIHTHAHIRIHIHNTIPYKNKDM